MTHRSKVERFTAKRTSFLLKQTPTLRAKRPKFFKRSFLRDFVIDGSTENLFQQLRAKSRGRIPSVKTPTEFIKPLNIRKTREFNFPNMFRGLFNV